MPCTRIAFARPPFPRLLLLEFRGWHEDTWYGELLSLRRLPEPQVNTLMLRDMYNLNSSITIEELVEIDKATQSSVARQLSGFTVGYARPFAHNKRLLRVHD